MNALKALTEQGQAVWLDFLARRFVAEGHLTRLITEDGLTGVTSNPAIFEHAIGHGGDYDEALGAIEQKGDLDPEALFETLAIADIQSAADLLRPVYDRSERRDGFVSLEVSPYLANDTAATIAEARRLWRAVGRENLMVKVPGTPAGLPAIRQLLAEGININITLLFSQQVYEQVVDAYLGGLEQFVAGGGDPTRLASVASFFVSRIDVAVDRLIEQRLPEAPAGERAGLEALRGKVAIANARLAYRRWRRRFSGPVWEMLKAKGARPQRLLWASTGTKNPAYSDVLYVEELIGPETVNTMPLATLDAFRDHGRARASLEQGVDEAERVMATLEKHGIAIDEVTDRLVEEGVRLFVEAADKLLGVVARKRRERLGRRLDGQRVALPGPLRQTLDATLQRWRREGNGRRLWARDAALWTNHGEDRWLGWLDIVAAQQARLDELSAFAEEIRGAEFAHAVLLGMGGSSLGPEVLATSFGPQPGRPALLVLDSTDPQQIRSIERRVDPARTLFIVASKSGTTLEPDILQRYFFARVGEAVGEAKAGRNFIAITDPGSALQQTAEHLKFRRVFFGRPSIGGRYSVLSDFGIVPAAVMGLDLRRLLDAAQEMVRSCDAGVPPEENPGVLLGAILGIAANAGRDKVTISASPGIAEIGAWLEQLLAESTGKQGKGIIPIDGEALGAPSLYGADRVFCHLQLEGEANAHEPWLAALERAGHPVLHFEVADRLHLGQEFFRWEMAVAVAGAVIGIDPFDQPDVEASKVKTRELTAAYEKTGKLPPEAPIFSDHGIAVFADARDAAALAEVARKHSLEAWLAAHLARIKGGDYCALLAYIERNERHRTALQALRHLIRDRKGVATCLGFGPRFLHSTGQAYKGGPSSGVFLQITAEDAADLPIPDRAYTFGVVKAAQARGDFDVLAERGRRALRIHLGRDVAAGLERLQQAVRRSLA